MTAHLSGYWPQGSAGALTIGSTAVGLATNYAVLSTNGAGVLTNSASFVYNDQGTSASFPWLGVGSTVGTNATALDETLRVRNGNGGDVARFDSNGVNSRVRMFGSGSTNGVWFGVTTTTLQINNADAGAIDFMNAGTTRWSINTSGHLVAGADNTYDIGASGATRPRHVYIGGTYYVPANGKFSSVSGNASLESGSFGGTVSILAGASALALRARGTQSSGTSGSFEFTGAAHTGLTASTDTPQFLFTPGSVQFATGAMTELSSLKVAAPTFTFVGASTITRAYTADFAAPVAGANATITDGFAANFRAKIRVSAGVALGGGAAPTLGTIGGSGPAAAAQNEWIEIWTQNGKRFVPAWA